MSYAANTVEYVMPANTPGEAVCISDPSWVVPQKVHYRSAYRHRGNPWRVDSRRLAMVAYSIAIDAVIWRDTETGGLLFTQYGQHRTISYGELNPGFSPGDILIEDTYAEDPDENPGVSWAHDLNTQVAA